MAWNGSGTFTRTLGTSAWAVDAAAGTKILSSRHDTNDQDLATGIQACLTTNNENKPTVAFRPATDNLLDLGASASYRWRSAYVGTSVVWQGGTYATTVTASPTANRAVVMPDGDGTIGLRSLQTTVSPSGANNATWSSLPSWIKKITMTFISLSSNGGNSWRVQIGDATGGMATAGYLGASVSMSDAASPAVDAETAGFGVKIGAAAASVHGTIVIVQQTAASFTWAASGTFARSDAARILTCAGSVTLSGVLDRVRVVTSGGDNFDAGSVNVLLE